MLPSGELRHRLARVLSAAYGDGLLSEATLAHRLDLVFGRRLVDPQRVTGDLSFRGPATILGQLREQVRRWLEPRNRSCRLLGLDWASGPEELLLGRDPSCDIVLADPTVSRRHARLRFSDGVWSLQDLDSTNGTLVNRSRVVRCRLSPGDHLTIGDEQLLVD